MCCFFLDSKNKLEAACKTVASNVVFFSNLRKIPKTLKQNREKSMTLTVKKISDH